MARTKGMLNLSGNLEVNAQAPLDARTIVPTEADLTVASNFPYPYVGLEVYVTGTGKKFRLTNLDTTQSSSWQEIGEGGGGSGLPSGGTQGQYLVKQSSTEGDADWQTLSAFSGATSQSAGSAGLVPAPSAGDEGKVLFGNGLWGALPNVDLSALSNEANILSTTEKAVGQNIDGKLIYQKTITGLNISLTWNYEYYAYAYIEKLIQNVEKIVGVSFYSNAGVFINGDLKQESTRWQVVTDELTWNINEMTVRYTKTTDSPLPSDVKFAGLLSNGTVVYKKTVATGGSAPSGTTLIYRLALLNSTDVVYFTM